MQIPDDFVQRLYRWVDEEVQYLGLDLNANEGNSGQYTEGSEALVALWELMSNQGVPAPELVDVEEQDEKSSPVSPIEYRSDWL